MDGEIHDLADPPGLNRYENHDIAVVVDRLVVKAEDRDRLADSVETALRTAGGVVEVVQHEGKKRLPMCSASDMPVRTAGSAFRNSNRVSSPSIHLTGPVRSAGDSAPGRR